MAQITVTGYVCNLKRYNNDDGSVLLYFSVSCRTKDPKRWSDNTQRDFWNVDLYVPKSRTKLVDMIQERKLLQVGGVPYKKFITDQNGKEGGRELAGIRGMADLVEVLPSPNTNNQQGNQQPPANQGNSQPQQQSQQPQANQQASQPASQQASQPANQTASQPANQGAYTGGPPMGEGW